MIKQTVYNGKTINVQEFNNYPNRPTIIFLHDSFGCIKLWRDFPEKLGKIAKCNVLIYERIGYGNSDPMDTIRRENSYLEEETDIFNDLIKIWNLDKVILFGHSDGGSISLLEAAKYPKNVLGIITVGAHVFVEDITVSGIGDAVKAYKEDDLKLRLEKYHKTNTDNVFWSWAKTWTSDEFRKWNIEQFLPMIKCPSLIIQGEKDEYGTLRQVESIINQTTGKSEAFIVPDTGHTPYKEKPDTILKRTAEFIQEL
ncbi:alpha/beta fold hydrolase [Fusobacterium sp. PH5-44]|uniref:alpha/beta fold hydrolase n=1 Tax=unclassified Fusobacterium TaxID=2648384 RepID=UPI003D20C684